MAGLYTRRGNSAAIRALAICLGLLVLIALPLFAAGQREARPVELRIATILPERSDLGDAMEMFKGLVEERSNGEIQVIAYYGAALGDEESALEQVSTNDIQMSVGGDAVVIWYTPEYDVTSIPFLFDDGQAVFELNMYIVDEYVNELLVERANLRVLAGSRRAPRNLLTVDRRIETPQDVQGLNMRLPPYESWVKAWEHLGAHPHPIAAAEQFSALEMGVVAATENPLNTLYNLRLHEPTNYVILTEHLHDVRLWSISEQFYQGLSDGHRSIVEQSVSEAAAWLTNRNLEVDQEYVARMREEGLEIVVPDRAAFSAAVRPVVDELRATWAPGLYENYVAPLLGIE